MQGGLNFNTYDTVQIFADEEVVRAKMQTSTSYPVMVRRWKSSVPEVTSLVELMVPVDKHNQVVALKEQISSHYGVPFDQIQLSEVDCFVSDSLPMITRRHKYGVGPWY